MKGGGKHLKAAARIAQVETALATGPKSPAELKDIMQCSDRLVRMYAENMPHVGSRIREVNRRRSIEYFLKSAEE